ncbi:Ku protein [Salinarimonas rosea]|uniref:non-homologous end joining protein Ku n=1 Tax=Salinarimonas rosea TaxID=552063 RepID=UPI0003F5276A|nr:Ku protein [Salinarimonas rosea]
MAARAIWKGYLKLSLVSCAVALYPAATSSAKVRFNTLNRETGNRVKRVYVDAETGEPVEAEDQVKGYKVGKNEYIQVEDEEIDALKLESTHTIDIETFVPRSEVDERYLDSPYYLVPDDKVAQEAFAVIRDAIREKGMAAIGRVVMARRERLILLEPLDDGLMGTTLHYAYEIRGEEEVFEDIPDVDYPDEVKDLALHIVETKTGHFEPETFEDRYENALVEMIRAKQSGAAEAPRPKAPQPSNVVNLMDALKRSLAAEEGGDPARKGPPSRTKAKARTVPEAAEEKGSKGSAKSKAAPSKASASKAAPSKASASKPSASKPSAAKASASGKKESGRTTARKPAAKQRKAS